MTPASSTSVSYRSIWNLTWPQMLMMVANFLIGFTDVWAAGRISPQVQASMGLVNQMLFFFLVVAFAVAGGCVAAISQSLGAGLQARARRYVVLVVALSVVMGLAILAGGQLCKTALMRLLLVPEELRPVCADFLDVFLPLLPVYYLLVVTNAVFRAEKRVFVPLAAMSLATVCNALGDLALGLGWWGVPAWGHMGLAWATFGSVSAATLLNLAVLWRGGSLARRGIPPWRWIRRAAPYLFKVAWPSGLHQVVWQSAYLALFAVVGSLPSGGVAALGGLAAGQRLESGLFLPGFAFSLTAQVLVAEALGRGSPPEAKRAGLRILAVGVVSLSLVAALCWPAVDALARFSSQDPEIQLQAASYLRYNLLAIPFTLTSLIMSGALGGAGATVYSLLVFGLSSWGVRLPLAYVLGHLVLGRAEGVWLAMLLSQGCQASLAVYMYLCRDWSRFAMRRPDARPRGLHAASRSV